MAASPPFPPFPPLPPFAVASPPTPRPFPPVPALHWARRQLFSDSWAAAVPPSSGNATGAARLKPSVRLTNNPYLCVRRILVPPVPLSAPQSIPASDP